MSLRRDALLLALLVLLAIAGFGVLRTGRIAVQEQVLPTSGALDEPVTSADQHSLAIAQELVRMATSPEERAVAQEALRLADKEMDLAFADAVRAVAMNPRRRTAELAAAEERLRRAQNEFATDERQLAQLDSEVARVTGGERAALGDRRDLAKAHLELVRDEVDDATQDFIRAGGDPQGRMDAMMREHEASSKGSDTTRINVVQPRDPHGLIRRVQAWQALKDKVKLLAAARHDADSASAAFSRRHHSLEGAGATDHGDAIAAGLSHAASAAMLLQTQRRALDVKTRGTLDQHVDNQHALAAAYGRWMAVVRAQARVALNRALRGAATLVAILLFGLLLDRLIDHRLDAVPMDRRRLQTAWMALRVSMQMLGVVLVLLVIFGVPDNLGTFLGLAGAGLTVALKDFIIGFLGWFVLMGRDGIGIGDLVEINGVTGEVVELGMFHTALLETGNWTDAGHLTGRRVTFTNSFAIEGHYFNFSTSGQWLWDEVRVVVPAGQDPSPIVDALQKQVEASTADSAARAERELKGARRSPPLSALTAAPSLAIKPILGGIEITVRYLTHVRERAELRAKLYREAVTFLGTAAVAASPPAAGQVPAG